MRVLSKAALFLSARSSDDGHTSKGVSLTSPSLRGATALHDEDVSVSASSQPNEAAMTMTAAAHDAEKANLDKHLNDMARKLQTTTANDGGCFSGCTSLFEGDPPAEEEEAPGEEEEDNDTSPPIVPTPPIIVLPSDPLSP